MSPTVTARIERSAWLAPVGAWAAWLALFVTVGFGGLNLQEDGYLLTLAERMVRGEVPYRDFEYIRPPLPIMIQAALVRWLPRYAVAESRWYFALEVGLILGAVYALLGRVETVRAVRASHALLASVFAFTGGFNAMPWHTVDGICFSVLAAWALVASAERRSPGLAAGAGLAAAAAALCKQGFGVVGVVGFALTLTLPGRRIGARPWTGALAYATGAILVSASMVGYLAAQGALAASLQSVLLDPREITREVTVLRLSLWGLMVGMHLPSPSGAALGAALLGLLTLRLPHGVRLGLIAGGLAWVVIAFWTWGTSSLLNRLFLVDAFSSLVWLGALGLLAARAVGRIDLGSGAAWTLGLGLCTLYASNWSFVRQFSGGQGLVLALPGLLLALLRVRLGGASGRDGAGRSRRFAAGCIMLYAALFAGLLQAAVPYRDGGRGDAIVPFASDRLRGLRSASLRVRSVDGVVELVRRETGAGDYVLAFMHFPALYFLTERRNPTRVDWFIPFELTMAEVRRAVADLGSRPPRLVILNARDPLPMVESPRLRPILGYILEHYEKAEAVGEFLILRPRNR